MRTGYENARTHRIIHNAYAAHYTPRHVKICRGKTLLGQGAIGAKLLQINSNPQLWKDW